MLEPLHTSLAAHLLLRTTEAAGIARKPLLSQAGVTEGDLSPSPLPMPWPALRRLTRAALAATQDPLLPFRAGADVKLDDLGLVGAVEMHSSPFREAKRFAFERSLPHGSTILRMWLEESGDWARMCAAPAETAAAAEALDIAAQIHLLLTVHMMSVCAVFGPSVGAERLCLRATDRIDTDALSKRLGCPVVLGEPVDCVVVARELMDRPLPYADPGLLEQLRPRLETYLQLADEGRVITLAVRTVVEQRLARGESTMLAAIAEAMKMPPRTIRARLADEATTFSVELDAVRKEFTLRRLAYPGVKLLALGAQVGFSDPAAFTRAFRRWTGTHPTEWLARHAGTGEALADFSLARIQ